MRTKKPISTISYNTEGFLLDALRRLQKAGKITEWYAIRHKGEDDEAGSKDHFHLCFFPNVALDETAVQPLFYEVDPTNTKPLKCLSWRPMASYYDWHQYVLHDEAYLLSKALTRRYHYTRDDMLCSDPDDYQARWYSTVKEDARPLQVITEAVKSNIPLFALMAQGKVAPTLNSRVLYEAVYQDQYERNRQQEAEEIAASLCDPITGEIASPSEEAELQEMQWLHANK